MFSHDPVADLYELFLEDINSFIDSHKAHYPLLSAWPSRVTAFKDLVFQQLSRQGKADSYETIAQCLEDKLKASSA